MVPKDTKTKLKEELDLIQIHSIQFKMIIFGLRNKLYTENKIKREIIMFLLLFWLFIYIPTAKRARMR